MKPLMRIVEPIPLAPSTPDFALWNLGFRPFYLLGSAFAAMSIGLWALQYAGWLPGAYLSGPIWHAHEMLFGFALAIVVGFLLTAGSNWSGRRTLDGAGLAALVALWVAGRILVLTPYGWAAALANVAFPLVAAGVLAVPFVRARNRRNYFFVGLLVLMAVAAGGVHLSLLGVLTLPAWIGLRSALDVLLFVMVVMSGRVLPMFTNNGVPGTNATRDPMVEKVAFGSVIALFAADALAIEGILLTAILIVGTLAHGWRWILWKPWTTVRVPIVWVLHVACAWIPVSLALRALAGSGWIASTAATHALTVGAAGGLIIGMITRTARGHTGRPLRADRVDVACYGLVLCAAPVRVFLPLIAPTLSVHAVLCAAALWSGGFGLYAVRYWPVLTRARRDGKPG